MADCLNNEEAINSQLSSTNTDTVSSNLDVDNGVSSELVGSNDMTSNIEGEETTTALLNEEEPLDSVLDQPTTSKYNGGETDNIVVSVDNSTHTITATLKPIKFKTVADFPVVGSDRLLYIDATENSLYSWDSDIGEYRKLVADTGDIEIDLDDYYKKTETDARYGASIEFGIDNSTYIITAQLKDANGNNLGVAKTIDLPLESVVVNGSYDSTTKEVVLTLDNGSEIKFSVADLVSGLQSEITATNKLASDLVDDTNSVNKFVTQGDKDKLSDIEEGANKTVVDTEFSTISTNPIANSTVTERLRDAVWKTTDQTINSVKTFEKQPKIADSVTESMAGRYIVSAERIQKFLRENYQEILVAGNNITFDGNTISANLEGSSPIVTLTSPVVIYDLPSGMYQLPAGCDLYINSSYVETDTKVNYDNTSVALMVVASITNPDSRVDKLFYLFAEADGQTTSTVGNTGSFIVGKAKQSSGHYHITGTDIKYVELEDDGWIGGNKSFVNPVKYYNQYESLATSLNDRTLVDAQWVKAQGFLNESELAGKGYLTSIPSEYVTETELAGKGYLTSVPSQYVTESELSAKGYLTSVPSEYVTETELTNKGYATQSSLNSTNSTVSSHTSSISSLSSTVSSHTSSISTLSKRYVTETYKSSDGNTWYTKYSDGWKECGGFLTSGNHPTSTNYTCSMPLSFSNTKYSLIFKACRSAVDTSGNNTTVQYGYSFYGYIWNKSTNSFQYRSSPNSSWYACGY